MTTGIIRAICISKQRGTPKSEVSSANIVKGFGIQGDAHGGDWHRQISLLSYDSVRKFNQRGAAANNGDFGENLLVEGIDFASLPVGTRLCCGGAMLEITQLGKQCHTHCQIYHRVGDCIMPREGVFARVINEGSIKTGDSMDVLPIDTQAVRAAVITLSDKGYAGKRKDESGPIIASMLERAGYQVDACVVLPDERARIEAELINFCDRRQVNLVVTTGGTGLSKRDITPEATMAVSHRAVPGISEAIRAYSLTITGRAMLSRGVSVIRGNTLIVNLPGSPKAVEESLEYVLPQLRHGIDILRGDAEECAR